ncbi:LamG-like jellyroll fold domain-containing protein [Pseudomonas chengduensis]
MSSGGKKTTVGYWYRLLYHFGLVKGPVDAFLEFRAGDRTAWKGQLTQSERISVNAENLWGGEKSEGGLSGEMDIMMGEPTQGPNAYLASELGSNQPAYRGKVSALWRGGRWGAMNHYPKAAAFKLRRILKGWDNDECWYPDKASIPMDTQVPQFTLSWTKTTGNVHTFSAPSEVSGWSHNPDDYAADPVGTSISWPTGVGATGIAWLHINAPGGVATEFHLDVKVNYDDSGKVIGTRGVSIGPATAPPDVATFPRAEGVRVVVPAHGAPFYGYVAFACVDVRDIETGATIGTPTNHRMLVSSTAVISSLEAMNPAHILYDSVTASDMQGEPVGMINDASFRAAADQFYSEGFGLCTTYEGGSIEDFQQRICDIIGGSLTQSRVDGEYYLDLIRGDYVLGSLPIITADDIVEFSHEPSVLTEQPNQVTVEWFDPEAKADRSTAPLQALGAIRAAGQVIPEIRSYPEIPTERLALKVGGRDLQAYSTPTSRYRLTINRRPFDLRPGRPFRLQYPAEGIGDMVCVLADIDTGTLIDGRIRIVAVQDVYGFPSTVYVEPEPGLAMPPIEQPVASLHQRLIEAPYIELVANMTRADLALFPDDAGVLLAIATRADKGLSYSVYSAAEGEEYAVNGSGEWCPSAVIVEAAGYMSPAEFTITNGTDLAEVDVGTWALWGDEIVRVDALDVEAGTLALGRGCADTPPAKHAAGSRIFFCGDWAGTDGREYVDGDTVRAKLLTRTSSDELDLIAAPELSLVMDQRQFRPYPPARLRLNDDPYPSQVDGDVSISWVPRDRLMQADKLFDSTMGAVGPEPGTTWSVRCYVNGVLDSSVDGLTVTDYLWEPSSNAGVGRVEVRSVRGGLASLYALSAEFDLAEPAALTFSEVVSAASPLFWYRMKATTGTTIVDQLGGSSATLSGTAGTDYDLAQPSIVGESEDYSVRFKGVGYAQSVSARTLPVANITLMAVVQINSAAPAGTIVSPHSINNPGSTSGSRDRALYVNSSGKLVAAIWAGSIQTIVSAANINDGLPHIIHLACGADAAAGSELYIDGVSVGTLPYISLDSAGTRYIQIGRSNFSGWPGGSVNTVQGKVCEVVWFNSRLNLESIRAQASAAGLRGW